jgi:hypothetical protein
MSNDRIETSSSDEAPAEGNEQRPARSVIHQLFRQFAEREDVRQGLSATIRHKRAGLLRQSFFDETGFTISPNYVYRILKNQLPTTAPVTIGDHTYDILPA